MSLQGCSAPLAHTNKSANIAAQKSSSSKSKKEISGGGAADVCLILKTLFLSQDRPSAELEGDIQLSSTSSSLPKDKNYLLMYRRTRSRSESSVDHLIQLKSEFQKESHQNYLSDVARLDYKVTFKNGFMYDKKGTLLSGAYIYVLLPSYELYAAPVDAKKHHSYFNGGLPVRGAGVMYVECGRLLNISNESGHYTPTFDEMMGALKWFSKKLRGYSYLFEDHSRQDKEKEFNGILYFYLHPASDNERYEITALENAKLVPTLFEIKEAAMKLYLHERTYGTHPFSLVDSKDDVPDESEENGVIYYTEITLDSLRKPINGPDIFNNPDLLKHLCLQNVDRGIFSYYGCHLKPSLKMQ